MQTKPIFANLRDKLNRASRDNRVFLVSAFVLLLLFYIARQPRTMLALFLHGEDGSFLLAQGWQHGVRSLFMPFAGYLNLVPRVIILLADGAARLLGDNAVIVPQLMKLATVLLDVLCVWYFCLDDFETVLRGKWLRFFAAVSIIAVSSLTLAVNFSITHIQWWMCIWVFLFGVNVIANSRFPKSRWTLFWFVCVCLSAPIVLPACLIVLFQVAREWAKTKKLCGDRWTLAYLVCALAAIAAQAIPILASGRAEVTSLFVVIKRVVVAIVYMSVQIIPLRVPEDWTVINTAELWSAVMVSALVWLLLALMLKGKRQTGLLLYTVLFLSAHWFMTFAQGTNYGPCMYEPFSTRYVFPAKCAVLILMFIAAGNYLQSAADKFNLQTGMAVALCCAFFFIPASGIIEGPMYSLRYSDMDASAMRLFSRDSEQTLIVPYDHDYLLMPFDLSGWEEAQFPMEAAASFRQDEHGMLQFDGTVTLGGSPQQAPFALLQAGGGWFACILESSEQREGFDTVYNLCSKVLASRLPEYGEHDLEGTLYVLLPDQMIYSAAPITVYQK